ncbi:MAG: pyridoxal-phosphate dependent enzyme [Anaerolineaceae bacterium]|nr:pyridoxal-phosphate dependent enzyme [Anaerolineaceae bacterium]
MLKLRDVAAARERLRPWLQPTPLQEAPGLGDRVWLKLENSNLTRSFKLRGALNAMLLLDRSARQRGVIACSSGNHAQGVAWASQMLGIEARLLMPARTPQRKLEGVRRLGAQAELFGSTYDESETEARRREREQNLAFISPYNDAGVIAGAGTIGLELLDDLRDLERVLVPVSGGGLISGIGLALGTLRPTLEIIGVCARSAPAMANLFHGSALPQRWDTLAEALSGEVEPDSMTIALVRRFVNRIVLVPEEAIAAAMRWMLLEHGQVVEGGGAVTIAALQCGAVDLDGRPTALVISGGNVDEATLCQILALV